MTEFFVYCYFNPLKPSDIYEQGFEPFYVGKGPKDRIMDHMQPSYMEKCGNKHKVNTIRKILKRGLKPVIIKMSKHNTDEEARLEEIRLIGLYGRADLQRGPLTNMTDGGDGAAGYVHTIEAKHKMSEHAKNRSIETRKKISQNMRNRSTEWQQKLNESRRKFLEDKTNCPMYGKKHTDESRSKMSATVKLRLADPVIKAKTSGENHWCAKSVVFEGVNYPTLKAAALATGLDRRTIKKRVGG